MTLADATPVIRHDGNGSATNFSFPYTFWEETELEVEHRTTAGVITIPVLNTDFTVNGGDGAVGTIDFPKAGSAYATLASGPPAEQLTIKRVLPEGRNTDLAGTYQFDTANLEGDEGMAIMQQLAETISRSIKIPVSDNPARVTELPGEAARAGLNLVFDANGDPGVGGVITVPEASIADINDGAASKYMPPDKFAQSIYGIKSTGRAPFGSATSVTTGDGTVGIPVTAELNGMNVIAVIAIVYTKGITGTTDIQIRRRRAGVDVDMLSTKITIGDEFFASDGVIDFNNDDLQTGDLLFVDRDTIHSGTAPLGLSIGISALKP